MSSRVEFNDLLDDDLPAELDDEFFDEILDPASDPRPDLTCCPKWLSPWAAKIVQMRDEGLAPESIAWRVEPLVHRYYRDQGTRRLSALESGLRGLTHHPHEYAIGAQVSAREIVDALWLMDAGPLPPPPDDARYIGQYREYTGKIIQMREAGCTIGEIRGWLWKHVKLTGMRNAYYLPHDSNIKYILRREGWVRGGERLPPPPRPKRKSPAAPSDLEVYEDTLDCVYAAWAAEHARTWRNRSRPIDMGGPRGVWIEDLPWEAVAA